MIFSKWEFTGLVLHVEPCLDHMDLQGFVAAEFVILLLLLRTYCQLILLVPILFLLQLLFLLYENMSIILLKWKSLRRGIQTITDYKPTPHTYERSASKLSLLLRQTEKGQGRPPPLCPNSRGHFESLWGLLITIPLTSFVQYINTYLQ